MTQDNKNAELVELLSKPEPFLTWLKSLDPSEVVGTRADAGDCPIARLRLPRVERSEIPCGS